jgi:hypothetical protein
MFSGKLSKIKYLSINQQAFLRHQIIPNFTGAVGTEDR